MDGAAQRLLCRRAKPPGCKAISTDTCVPISRLADCLLESVDEAEASGLPPTSWWAMWATATSTSATCWTPTSPERVTAEALNHKLVARALSMGGTCTGEHGVGVHKMGFCWTKPAQARWT